MDQYDHELDPFSSESLWRLSKFSIEALQPLESLVWNTTLSSKCQPDFPQNFVDYYFSSKQMILYLA
jgi:hypothetical protein